MKYLLPLLLAVAITTCNAQDKDRFGIRQRQDSIFRFKRDSILKKEMHDSITGLMNSVQWWKDREEAIDKSLWKIIYKHIDSIDKLNKRIDLLIKNQKHKNNE